MLLTIRTLSCPPPDTPQSIHAQFNAAGGRIGRSPPCTLILPDRRGNNILALQFHGEMGLDPRFDEWLRQWPDALAETGGCAEGMRDLHLRHGPSAVAAGRNMIAEWLSGLSD